MSLILVKKWKLNEEEKTKNIIDLSTCLLYKNYINWWRDLVNDWDIKALIIIEKEEICLNYRIDSIAIDLNNSTIR